MSLVRRVIPVIPFFAVFEAIRETVETGAKERVPVKLSGANGYSKPFRKLNLQFSLKSNPPLSARNL
jgi:hypothetical protein